MSTTIRDMCKQRLQGLGINTDEINQDCYKWCWSKAAAQNKISSGETCGAVPGCTECVAKCPSRSTPWTAPSSTSFDKKTFQSGSFYAPDPTKSGASSSSISIMKAGQGFTLLTGPDAGGGTNHTMRNVAIGVGAVAILGIGAYLLLK